ncbi:hypothetical protein O5626_27930, partial [Escherichia coli]|nr:hypothetical protein [Escherichia coli]
PVPYTAFTITKDMGKNRQGQTTGFDDPTRGAIEMNGTLYVMLNTHCADHFAATQTFLPIGIKTGCHRASHDGHECHNLE